MLPDMPSLGGTPVKKQSLETEVATTKNDDTNVTVTTKEQDLSFASFSFQFHKTESTQVRRNFEGICDFSSNANEQKDNPDDITELMIASSTVKNVTKKEPSGAEKKRAKLRREFIANLVMATPDDAEKEIQKEESFADAFFDKMKQTLASEDYCKLIDILAHYDETNGEFVDLYQNVQSILCPKYEELSGEFLLFLTGLQAHKIGQLMPYFVMKDMNRFMKKLQVYFKDQPSHLRKLLKCITDLSENPDVTIDIIKTTVLPLFKGNVALTEWFLQLFPCEKPPNILSNGPHEVIDITKELARPPDEDIYETVVLPDTEDPYGGPACICLCHNNESPQFKSRSQHCVKCGLKFIQGKIYIQTGKALRPAVVSFLTNPEKDHTKRLSATQRKRSDTSPSKQVTSPNKESHTHEETRHSNESDDECDGGKKKRLSKSQRKRKIKHQDKANVVKDPGKATAKETSSKASEKIKTDTVKPPKSVSKRASKKKSNSVKKPTGYKPGSTSGQQKRPAEEQLEIGCVGPPELVELKVSSDHSGESESEFFESSQDITNTDSDDSNVSTHSNTVQQTNGSGALWTREEDKTILQAFRQRSDNEETFKHISEVLQNRSVVEIKNRFHKLMSLLQQMASNSTS